MDTCKTYPKFEADQVLTADQLNKLFSYLDSQNKWTRKCFIGAGIACGFQVEVNKKDEYTSITISAGTGLTTLGYIIKNPELVCKRYAEYTDPVQYSFFKENDEQVQLWELLPVDTFDTEDSDNKPIDIDFLKDKVALLYLQVKDVDLDTCTGSDCDEQGIETSLCVKILLIEKEVLDQLNNKKPTSKLDLLYDKYLEKYALPTLNVGRLHWLGDEDNLLDLKDIQLAYQYLMGIGTLTQLPKTLTKAYNTYAPLLAESYQVNPFIDWRPQLDQPLAIQYFYDHIKDLILAYNEFNQYAFDVFFSCCIPDDGFPKHLMLGRLYEPKKCMPSAYRQQFITAMEPAGGEHKIKRVQSLFKRLVLLTQSFKIPVLSSAAIKLTPSKEKNTPLSQRSIPYYYDLDKYPELKTVWNFDLANRCLSNTVLNYSANDCVPNCSSNTRPKFSVAVRNEKTLLIDNIRESGRSPQIADRFISEFSGELSSVKFDRNSDFLESLRDNFHFGRRLDPVRFPLNSDLNEYPFFRIEGHLGKDYYKASTEITKWIKCYNLPIKLVGLKVGDSYKDIDLSFNCEFEDIDLIYQSQREKINCYFKQTLDLIRSIKFDEPEDDLEESTLTKVTGRFVDEKTGKPLANVVYTISKSKRFNIKSDFYPFNRTDKSGVFEFSNLTPAIYIITTSLSGYESKSFRASIKQGKTLKMGDIALHQDSYYFEGELLYKLKDNKESSLTATKNVMLFAKRVESRTATIDREEKNVYLNSRALSMEIESKADIKTKAEQEFFQIESYAAEVAEDSPYSIGKIYKELILSDTDDLLSYSKQYIYKNFAKSKIKETDDVLEKIYQPLQIATTLNKLIQELGKPLLQFDKDYFKSLYQKLLTQIEKFKVVITGGKYGDLFSEADKEDIIRYFNLLRQENCFNQFQSLMDAYQARSNKIQFHHLLSVYSSKNTGMSHVAGSPAGGTFFLVYDDSKKVVLDFSLPYICCSDCPPIQYCNGYPVIFKLPQEQYCKADIREFKFITNFPGGEVIGSGVIKNETTGDFYFKPNADDVKEGKIDFIYFLNDTKYEYSVMVDDPQVSITYNLVKIDSVAETAEVQFSSVPEEALEYEWNFGDETPILDQSPTSNQPTPVHTYDISNAEPYTVTLRAKQNLCYAEASHSLTFEICNAEFSYREVERTLTTISYAFKHPQAAKQRTWNLGDTTIVTDSDSFIHVYDLTETARGIEVKLSITQETCEDNSSVTITIPALKEVTIFMNKFSLCRGDAPEQVNFDPANGVYDGNGLVPNNNGEIFFHPAHPDVVLGDNEITYEVEGQKTTINVRVSAIEEQFSTDVKLIDGVEMTADVQFIAPLSMDSYSFDLGNGEKSVQQSFLHQYDIREQTKFDITALLTNGACNVTQTSILDLTPCSAEFTSEIINNNGESITFEYTMIEEGGTQYQLEDELGTERSPSRTIRHNYPLQNRERNMVVSMTIKKPPCINSSSSTIVIPAIIPLNIILEKIQFVSCDEERYPLKLSSGDINGVFSGPGVRTEGNDNYFSPILTNARGNVTIIYTQDQRSTSLTVNIKRPQAIFAIKSIKKIDNTTYDVSVINKSIDNNRSAWQPTPRGRSIEREPVFRLKDVNPGDTSSIKLSVSWDGLCSDSTVKPVLIPIEIDRGRSNSGVIRNAGTPILGVIRNDGILTGGVRRIDGIPIEDVSRNIGTPTPDVSRNIDALKKLTSSEAFSSILPRDHEAIVSTQNALKKLQVDLSSPEISRSYASGSKDAAISRLFKPLITATLGQLSISARESGPEKAQLGYPLFLLVTSQIIDLIGFSKKDLSATGALTRTFNSIIKALAGLSESGINIDPDRALTNIIKPAMLINKNKPNTMNLLNKIMKLLG